MLGPNTFAASAMSWWHCIPCGATNTTEPFCCICGRPKADATDRARWDRFFTLDAVIAEDPEPCRHDHVDLAMDDWDPAKERTDAGICADCGEQVHLEHDDDRVYWEID